MQNGNEKKHSAHRLTPPPGGRRQTCERREMAGPPADLSILEHEFDLWVTNEAVGLSEKRPPGVSICLPSPAAVAASDARVLLESPLLKFVAAQWGSDQMEEPMSPRVSWRGSNLPSSCPCPLASSHERSCWQFRWLGSTSMTHRMQDSPRRRARRSSKSGSLNLSKNPEQLSGSRSLQSKSETRTLSPRCAGVTARRPAFSR